MSESCQSHSEADGGPGPKGFEAGMSLPDLALDVTREQLIRFAGAVDDYGELHWDHLFMVEQGYSGVIVHGWLTASLMCRVATDWEPLRLASFDGVSIRYLRPNLPGRSVYRGRIASMAKGPDGCRLGIELWAENPAGQRIAEGSISAWLETAMAEPEVHK